VFASFYSRAVFMSPIVRTSTKNSNVFIPATAGWRDATTSQGTTGADDGNAWQEEVERIVNASGNVSLGDHLIRAGMPLAGQWVTLRLDGPIAHTLSGGTKPPATACLSAAPADRPTSSFRHAEQHGRP
jgi:hypothetical protein